mgnify:CR=1 FL=1
MKEAKVKLTLDAKDFEKNAKVATGSVQDLKNRLKDATDTFERSAKGSREYENSLKRIQVLNGHLTGSVSPLKGEMNGLTDVTNRTALTLTNMKYVVQDLPYGLRGIGNNITPLISSITTLNAVTGSFTLTMKALWTTLKGPLGIILAIDALITVLTMLEMKNQSVGKSTKEMGKSTNQFLRDLKDEMKYFNMFNQPGMHSPLPSLRDREKSLNGMVDMSGLSNKQITGLITKMQAVTNEALRSKNKVYEISSTVTNMLRKELELRNKLSQNKHFLTQYGLLKTELQPATAPNYGNMSFGDLIPLGPQEIVDYNRPLTPGQQRLRDLLKNAQIQPKADLGLKENKPDTRLIEMQQMDKLQLKVDLLSTTFSKLGETIADAFVDGKVKLADFSRELSKMLIQLTVSGLLKSAIISPLMAAAGVTSGSDSTSIIPMPDILKNTIGGGMGSGSNAPVKVEIAASLRKSGNEFVADFKQAERNFNKNVVVYNG